MKILKIFILLLFSVSVVQATNKKAGTSGAQFLKIGAGSRSTAMGEAFVGIADDVNAVYFNPGGISYISRPELIALHAQWIQGINFDFAAFAYPTDYGAFAVSAATLKVADLEKRSSIEALQGTFEAMDSAYALTYARNLNPRLALGITGRYLYQEIDTASAGTWTGDVGIVQRCIRWPLTFGLAVKHFGESVRFNNESDPPPFTIDGGVGVSMFREKLTVGLDLKHARDNAMQYAVGAEFLQPLNQDFKAAFRGGYNTYHQEAGGHNGISCGAGLTYRQFSFDFAWVPLGDLGDSFRYSVRLKF